MGENEVLLRCKHFNNVLIILAWCNIQISAEKYFEMIQFLESVDINNSPASIPQGIEVSSTSLTAVAAKDKELCKIGCQRYKYTFFERNLILRFFT